MTKRLCAGDSATAVNLRPGTFLGVVLTVVMLVAPASAAELTGTVWKLVDIAAGKATRRHEIHFERGTISGFNGCNRFRGEYSIIGQNHLRIRAKDMVMTKMACPPESALSSTALMCALGSARSWRIRGERLYLMDRRGRPVATFRQ